MENTQPQTKNEFSKDYLERIQIEIYDDIKKKEDELDRYNNKLLNLIYKYKGDKFEKSLKELIKDVSSDWGSESMSIVRKTEGQRQDENFGEIKEIWVNQWSCGDSGDSFAGSVYVKLDDKRFLEIPYAR